MSCSTLQAQNPSLEAISHREFRRRLFGKGLKEEAAKSSAKEEFGKNKGLKEEGAKSLAKEEFGKNKVLKKEGDRAIAWFGKNWAIEKRKQLLGSRATLCEALDGASMREVDPWDLTSQHEECPPTVNFMNVLGAESVGNSCQVKLEMPMKEEDKEDKWILPRFEARRLEEKNEFLWLPRRAQVENIGSENGMDEEERTEQLGLEEEEEEEYECGWNLFDGKEEHEWDSLRLDAWPPRSELPRSIEVENEGSAMGMEEEEVQEMMGLDDTNWLTLCQYRREWNDLWSGSCGSFEDTTRVLSMRFTKKPPLDYRAFPLVSLQIFSVKLAAIRGGLQLPLDVFGMVAIRDTIDHNLNTIFCRRRDSCQNLTEEDPYLELTGPSQAVIVTVSSPVVVQVELKVKGSTESEDKDLSRLVARVACGDTLYSRLLNCDFTSKFSTLEFTLGHIVSSVVATIFVRVIQGSWPDGLRGKFGASTTCYKPEPDINQKKIILLDSGSDTCYKSEPDINQKKIILLDSGSEEVKYSDDGQIKLSRSVVSVEATGRLKIIIEALKGNNRIAKRTRSFKASKYGTKRYKYKMGFCELLVTVAWSLLSDGPVYPVETPKKVEVCN